MRVRWPPDGTNCSSVDQKAATRWACARENACSNIFRFSRSCRDTKTCFCRSWRANGGKSFYRSDHPSWRDYDQPWTKPQRSNNATWRSDDGSNCTILTGTVELGRASAGCVRPCCAQLEARTISPRGEQSFHRSAKLPRVVSDFSNLSAADWINWLFTLLGRRSLPATP